jgi:hypothetical protein
VNSVGWWTLHYDWEVKGVFNVAQIYFNFDGTFGSLAGANDGTWTEADGMIIWRFKPAQEEENNTVYSGNLHHNIMLGIMFNSNGVKGQWYAVKKGTKLYLNEETPKLQYLMDKQSSVKYHPNGKPV